MRFHLLLSLRPSSVSLIFRIHGRIGYHEVVVLQGNGISFIVSLIGEQVVKSFGG